jgi:NitT/TauT family transport system substrate-binding protein
MTIKHLSLRKVGRTGTLLLLPMVLMGACGGDGGSDGGAADGEDELPVVRIQVLSGGMSAIGLRSVEESESDIANGFRGEFHYVDGDTANQFFLQGESDVAYGLDPISVAIFRNEGHDVSTYYQNQPNYACLVSQPEYDAPEDLIGERVGNTGPDSGTTQSLAVTLQRFWDISLTEDYEPVEAQAAALVELLKSGEIEAAGLFEPHTSRAVVEGGAKCLTGHVGDVWAEEIGGTVSYTSLVAFNEWIDQDPDLALAVAQAMADGAEWLSSDPSRIEEEPFASMTGSDDPAVFERLETLIADGSLYDVDWGPEIIDANTQMLDSLAEQGVLLQEVPDGVFRELDEE